MNHVPVRDLEHNLLWDRHEFALSNALCIWANYFVVPTMTRAETSLGLNRDDCNVLISLWLYETVTASDICFLVGRPRNSISRAVNRLLERKYIKAAPNSEDARKSDLTMTNDGKAVMSELVPIFAERQNLMLRRLGKRQQVALHRLLSETLKDASRWAEDLPLNGSGS